ncbi:MAG: polyribonucleotide nucleotidyltransferase [Microthrixaceae bacterium]|nr:polyribonucleotide nucleotidyltransferase [Microthrixaceae bacterium]
MPTRGVRQTESETTVADAIRVESSVGGDETKTMSFEAGKLAALAGGAVLASLGDTEILVTATAAKSVRDGIDFFPLTVDIEERSYAAGKIPGSFFRREGKASDQAILTCRLIDRPLRPSFPEGFRNEVHIVGTVVAADMENPHDVLAINAASAALCLSDVPFEGPIGAVRLAYDVGGEWVAHPTYQEGDASVFEVVVAGRELEDGDVAIMMVEAGGTEKSWEFYSDGAPKVDESALAAGLQEAKKWIKEAIALQRQLVEAAGGKKPVMEFPVQIDYTDEQYAAVKDLVGAKVADAMTIADKAERTAAEAALRDEVVAGLAEKFAGDDAALATKQLKAAFKSLTKQTVRSRIVNEGARIDGRGTRDLRPLSAEVGILPTTHGSGLFQRGETQVLNVATLAMGKMDQMIDGITPLTSKRYMHHYNFPPFSTGETGFMRGPKRREIGHGMLAERALVPVIPPMDEFPYVIRTVSDVLASNGSTSMASVCGSTLSLMDAGVPLKAPVAGIAMGLVFAEGKYTTLTDILGAEDAYGDMDFKVAGTAEFVTALQLDTKIDGIPADVLAAALEQAKEARLAILEVMHGAIPENRAEVSPNAPKIVSFEIPADKIGEIIGPKGKVINAIQAETGANISVDDDGMVGVVSIAAVDPACVTEAERQIRLILNPPTAGVGEVYTGKVVNITKFGAFVNILPGRDGLVHISKLGGGKRIDSVESVLSLGDEIEVRVEDIDPNGKISLRPTADGGEGGDDPKAEAADAASDRNSDAPADEAADSGSSRPRGAASAPVDAGANGNAEGAVMVSFEDFQDEKTREVHGELGPVAKGVGGGGGRDRGRKPRPRRR